MLRGAGGAAHWGRLGHTDLQGRTCDQAVLNKPSWTDGAVLDLQC